MLPVALHEIGHVLGLTHADAPGDVMSAFYDGGQCKLCEGDITRVQLLCQPSTGEGASVVE